MNFKLQLNTTVFKCQGKLDDNYSKRDPLLQNQLPDRVRKKQANILLSWDQVVTNFKRKQRNRKEAGVDQLSVLKRKFKRRR